ncbi:MAG: peptidase M20 [Acidobacteria bacterium RIFCSPLOWO2_12_FULL_60_22]|nr:MAG: peptidase M20 [Acidobacteria bacterium RIFCSPLOWO2_12_FULL_60_22]
MDALLLCLKQQQDEMLAMVKRMVEVESPSTEKTAVDHFGEMVATIARSMGARVRFYPSQGTGNHLRAEFRLDAGRAAGQILLLGHLDTVWEIGSIARMPFRIERGRAYGPGVFDMKSGIVMGLFALSALRSLRIPVKKEVVLLLNADEEIGSPSSRPITEQEARQSDAALVLEPAHGRSGALKTARKGVGEFEVRVKGRAAHAGLEPEKGINAIVELSRQILRLEKMADPKRGITISPDRICGGTRSNVIPEEASVAVDVRVLRIKDQAGIDRKLRSLRPCDRRARLEVTGGFNRPPLERTPAVAALFERACRLARPLGLSLRETTVGGGSDGNFTAALGIPTLDGLGAVGEGAHAVQENIIINELPRRAALLAHLIADLSS